MKRKWIALLMAAVMAMSFTGCGTGTQEGKGGENAASSAEPASPGEGEAEFEELCAFLREQKIQRAGVFQFSPEEGTLAAAMENQVDGDIAARRVELAVDLQSRIMDEYNEQRLGSCMEVLCEGFDTDAGCYVGRTYADSIDIDGRVLFTAAELVPAGEFVWVRITGMSDGDLMGEIEEVSEWRE